jgi:F-type H+-transporting ATPase subunit gamma
MCGGLNSSLFRFTLHEYTSLTAHDWVTVGTKGSGFIAMTGGKLFADFSDRSSFASSVPAIASLVTEEFLKGTVDGVDIIYNEFQSVLKQVPGKKSILPLSIEGTDGSEKEALKGTFLIEPNPEEVFEALLPSYVENQIRNAILQAEASEHAARMVAMRNATDNAKSFIGELTLVYNKGRQEKITNEIADLVTARAAIVSE